jgi:hypothetical protein
VLYERTLILISLNNNNNINQAKTEVRPADSGVSFIENRNVMFANDVGSNGKQTFSIAEMENYFILQGLTKALVIFILVDHTALSL